MTHLIVGGLRTTFPKLKSNIDLKNEIQQQAVTDEIESAVDDATDLIYPSTVNQLCETMMEEHVTIEEDPTTLATTALLMIRNAS